jgi:hypothetical protein
MSLDITNREQLRHCYKGNKASVKEQIEYNTKYAWNKNIDTIEQNMSAKGTRLVEGTNRT